MRRRKDIWFLILLFVLLFVGGIWSVAPQSSKEDKISSTYNPDPNGVKALYTLLGERLGYNVGRLEQPLTDIPKSARVLIVIQPQTEDPDMPELFQSSYIDDEQSRALRDWVKRGGTVMFYSDNLEGVPAAFGSDQKIGRGWVYAVNSRKPITNRGMRDTSNAVEIVRRIERHAGKKDLILFDEYHHGFSSGDSFWSQISRQVWVATGIVLLSAVLLCFTYGRRFGAIRELPKESTLRPGFEFVKSAGRLYERSGASDLAAEILCRSFKRRLCAKLGLPSDASSETVVSRLTPEIGARVSALLSACGSYAAGHKPSKHELLEVASQIHELEQELRLGRIDA